MCRILVEVFLDSQPNSMLEEHTMYIGVLKHFFLLCVLLRSAAFYFIIHYAAMSGSEFNTVSFLILSYAQHIYALFVKQ